MGGLNPVGIAVLIAALLGGAWAGSSLKQAQWDRAENKALKVQQELLRQSEEERNKLNDEVLESQLRLEHAEHKVEVMSEEIQNAINREPVVTTVTVETSKDCPVVKCNIPDAAQHYRLFNCGINNSCETVPAAGKAGRGDAAVPQTSIFTSLDEINGLDEQSQSF